MKRSSLKFAALSIVSLLCVITLTGMAVAKDPNYTLQCKGSAMALEARDAALLDILGAIARETGISLKPGDLSGEKVSCSIPAGSLEDVVKKLLSGRNYIIKYQNKPDGRSEPVELIVLGARSKEPVEARPAGASTSLAAGGSLSGIMPENTPKQNDSEPVETPGMQMVGREYFERAVENVDALSKQINAVPVEGEPLERGIRIDGVSEDLSLPGIGIANGDIIQNVNGTPVRSVQQFLEAINSIPPTQTIVRIERIRKGIMAPIYIELQ